VVFIQNAPEALDTTLRFFLRVILASPQAHSSSPMALDRTLVQLADYAFIPPFWIESQ
jgi:hypothetical protein